MATGGAMVRNAGDIGHDNEETNRGEAGTLHERLVAYVHKLEHGARRGVWGEHSYARSKIGNGRGSGSADGRVRVLLAPRVPSPPPTEIDVTTPPSPPPSPPASPDIDVTPLPMDDDETDTIDWESRIAATAPSDIHSKLFEEAADTLRCMRLERMVNAGRSARRDQAAEAAQRLRQALAPLWLKGGVASWLHGALSAHLPRSDRRLYDEIIEEFRRSVPRLAERLTGTWVPPPPVAPLACAVGPESSPWLVWVSSGVPSFDARWERRLAMLVHTRVLRGVGGARGTGPAPPEPWCAAAVGAVRSALTDALAEAGSRSIVLGGLGAGAAAALVLARGAGSAGGAGGVRGLVLAAPPLLTAEGPRDVHDDAIYACRLPLLLIVGTDAPDAGRIVPNNICEDGPCRRLLEVRGCDSELRLPRRLRQRHRLPQHALDAAVVEECVRWVIETAEQEEPSSPPTPEKPRRVLPPVIREIDLTEEEYSHLPPAASSPAPASAPASPAPSIRTVEISEGRTVTRVSGGTPVALVPPPRRAPLAAHDIMRLPIVFADDAHLPVCAPVAETSSTIGSPVTVTSGKSKIGAIKRPLNRADGKRNTRVCMQRSGDGANAVKFTRVILAKRGGAVASTPRRLLLRRGVRLMPQEPQQ